MYILKRLKLDLDAIKELQQQQPETPLDELDQYERLQCLYQLLVVELERLLNDHDLAS